MFFIPLVIPLIVYAIVMVVLMAIAYLLTSGGGPGKAPGEPDKRLDFPTVEEGKPIGLLYGTKEIRDPSVVMYWGMKIRTVNKTDPGVGKKQ